MPKGKWKRLNKLQSWAKTVKGDFCTWPLAKFKGRSTKIDALLNAVSKQKHIGLESDTKAIKPKLYSATVKLILETRRLKMTRLDIARGADSFDSSHPANWNSKQ